MWLVGKGEGKKNRPPMGKLTQRARYHLLVAAGHAFSSRMSICLPLFETHQLSNFRVWNGIVGKWTFLELPISFMLFCLFVGHQPLHQLIWNDRLERDKLGVVGIPGTWNVKCNLAKVETYGQAQAIVHHVRSSDLVADPYSTSLWPLLTWVGTNVPL